VGENHVGAREKKEGRKSDVINFSWNMTPCSLASIASSIQNSVQDHLSMLGLIFYPEDESTTFLTRQCTYNVTWRRVRAIIGAVEK